MSLFSSRIAPLSRSLDFCKIFKRTARRKPPINILLKETVEGVGNKAGYMRNVLLPRNKASYIQVYTRERQALEAGQHQREQADQLLVQLRALQEPLEFQRAVVPGTTGTFGSVTLEDVIDKLRKEFGISVDKHQIEFNTEGGKLKALGEYELVVKFPNLKKEEKLGIIVKATQ
ncbi:hypothetical protein BC937DRAFT_87033 [Endogone sp. FLAS-F59071]|nr:hypothetical protein BC937DRAFT_87033 [Endogone sp. FLAS-F59071]|eukprot:RUS12787.1 hypothetical protein BC937DRAFT_87033 [Endogone sp. FLAS-F59071]